MKADAIPCGSSRARHENSVVLALLPHSAISDSSLTDIAEETFLGLHSLDCATANGSPMDPCSGLSMYQERRFPEARVINSDSVNPGCSIW